MSWTGQLDSLLKRKFISCTSGNNVPRDVWWKGEPNNIEMKELCVAIKFDSKNTALVDVRCGEKMNVICEVRYNIYGNVVYIYNYNAVLLDLCCEAFKRYGSSERINKQHSLDKSLILDYDLRNIKI
jgi:hypothetical protein